MFADGIAAFASMLPDPIDGSVGNAGHEASGTVLDPGASQFRVGDRVGLSAIVGCGECERCLAGQEVHCREGAVPSGSIGWHAELAAVHPSALRELPEGTDAGLGTLISGDALGVPARVLRRVASDLGDSVLVIGLGPIGLGHVLVRAFAGAEVVAIEPSEYRRKLGLELGAKVALAPGDEIDLRPKLVIECTGRPDCVTLALDAVDNGGTVVQSGECHVDVPINPSNVFIRREVTYTGSWYYAGEDYASMLELVGAGLPLDRLCTHDVAAADAQPAIADFLDGKSGKVVIRWNEV